MQQLQQFHKGLLRDLKLEGGTAIRLKTGNIFLKNKEKYKKHLRLSREQMEGERTKIGGWLSCQSSEKA